MVQLSKLLLAALFWASVAEVLSQDYEVADISCTFSDDGDNVVKSNQRNAVGDLLTARLRKPDGFRGVPIFADDHNRGKAGSAATSASSSSARSTASDPACRIDPDPADPDGLMYDLRVTDMAKCGVLKKNGFVNVRIWFPRLPGVVMMSDQEVIIMCKPAESVVTKNKAAGFAGKLPPAARVSGIVEESPGKLEYEVALFRESSDADSPPRRRNGNTAGAFLDSNSVSPVEQAVPIGTRLQLRASINAASSAWKYVKLTEVTVSSDPRDAYAQGHIKLIKNGCRAEEFQTIVPRQPYHPPANDAEVRMEFEAVLLDAQRDRANQLWIHARIKACVAQADCEPELCLDLYQPVGAGRRRRRALEGEEENGSGEIFIVRKEELVERDDRRNFFPVGHLDDDDVHQRRRQRRQQQKDRSSSSADFKDNVGVTVILPGEEYFSGIHAKETKEEEQSSSSSSFQPLLPSVAADCGTFLVVGAVLGSLLVVASVMMCILSHRLYKVSRRYNKEKLDEVVREHRRKFGKPPQGGGGGVAGLGGGVAGHEGGGLFRMQHGPTLGGGGVAGHRRPPQHHHHAGPS